MAAAQVVFFTLLAGCATGGAPGAPAQPQAQRPREFVRVVAAVNSTPVALNQMIGAATGSQPGMEAISAMVSSGLTIVDHAGVIQPLLAESVPTVENGAWKVSPDGQMEITWKIRPGAQWHDGTAFTAADIVFTQQVQLDRDIALFGHSSYRQLDTVEAPDPRTVTTRWKGAFIYANLTFGYDGDRSLMPLPKHLLEKSFQEDKAGFASLPYWTSQFVGTGAYRLKEWVEGSHVVVQANDQYVLGRPKIDEIEVKFIPDRNTLLSNMLAGTVEVNLGRGLEPAEARQVLERMEGWKTDNAVIGAFAAYPQFINPDPPLLANVQLRRALHHAIDRQEMLDTLYFGQSTIAHSFLHDGEPDFKDGDSVTVKYPYDPGRATQLIEQLGYRKGADGGFRDPAGQRLSIEARTGRGSENIMLDRKSVV